MSKRKPKQYKCKILNLDEIDLDELERKTMGALATALSWKLSPEELDQLIYMLRKECNKDVS